MNEKYCPYCFELLVQREDEADDKFSKRIYCGKSCSSYHTAEKKRRKK